MLRLLYWYVFIFCMIVVVMPSMVIKGCPADSACNYNVKVYDTKNRRYRDMDLETYIKGVLAAEMPANFSPEALKAQAVAIRTFTLEKLSQPGRRKYGPGRKADFTDRAEEGQAWLTKAALIDKWGYAGYKRNWPKICQAVDRTRGEVITYKGRLIKAFYHSTCGSFTEDAKDVWGMDLPYLCGKKCPFDYESPRFQEEKKYSWARWVKETGLPKARWEYSVPVTSQGARYMQILEKTASGRIKTLALAGKVMRGEDLRRKLTLASSNFSFLFSRSGVVVKTRGYGHGVGLCQYGANGLSKKGYNYLQIIKYYYSGVNVVKIKAKY